MDNIQTKLKKFTQGRFFRHGLPFILLMLGGTLGVREFAQIRYQFRRQSSVNPQEAEKYKIKMKNPGEVTLESEFEKVKKLDIDNWTNIRGPRPWEEETLKQLPKERMKGKRKNFDLNIQGES